MRGKAFSAFLAVTLAACLCPTAAFAEEDTFALTPSAVGIQSGNATTCDLADVASGSVTWDEPTRTVTMTNATIDLDDQSSFTMAAIKVDGQLESSTPTITLKLNGVNTIKGGSYVEPIWIRYANLAIAGTGQLNINSATATYAIGVDGTFTASTGKINIIGGEYGLHCMGNAVFNGVSFSTKNASMEGISSGGSITISKGVVSATGTGITAISATGKLTVSGGKVTAQTLRPTIYSALHSGKSVSTKSSCLKSIKGSLGKGATFAVSGSTYTVSGTGYGVTLKSYGSSSKSPKVNTVSYGGVSYSVTAIGAKAFSTKKGKAITSLTLGSNVKSIGAKAFYGTSKLTTLNVKNFYYYSAKISKGAFTKCGKSSGVKLKVLCPSYSKSRVKTLFIKKGMSKKATFAG